MTRTDKNIIHKFILKMLSIYYNKQNRGKNTFFQRYRYVVKKQKVEKLVSVQCWNLYCVRYKTNDTKKGHDNLDSM